ncbi:unnamed protein product [Oncorhynchus mykiss]|uniref:Reverse transcriptase domain-containing protein n=1 Tax=Oncorhynchus mykiss TaxID=8022 RepID=A0A060XVB8_ONCMY|nr:unnamed protein product [Oncorhynchus mykiss]
MSDSRDGTSLKLTAGYESTGTSLKRSQTCLCLLAIGVIGESGIHLDKRRAYVRMLFVDYSSAFNTIVPSKITSKLRALGLNSSLCN